MLYWGKLLREAGIDPTDLQTVTHDRKKWKRLVKERMKWLDTWEKSAGHHWKGERGERNVGIYETGVHVCGVCGKVCRSKGGLVVHRRRMHEVSTKKKEFKCEACNESFLISINGVDFHFPPWKTTDSRFLAYPTFSSQICNLFGFVQFSLVFLIF